MHLIEFRQDLLIVWDKHSLIMVKPHFTSLHSRDDTYTSTMQLIVCMFSVFGSYMHEFFLIMSALTTGICANGSTLCFTIRQWQ